MYPPVSKSEAVYGSVTEIWFLVFCVWFSALFESWHPRLEASPSSSDLAVVSPLGAMGARLPEPTEGPASCKVWEIKTLGRTDDARARELSLIHI